MPAGNDGQVRFLTVEQVADELSATHNVVRALLRSGEMRGFQLGQRKIWRIASVDLEHYIDNAYQETADRIARGVTE